MQHRFVYLIEGVPYAGDLKDYAKAYENAYYSGIDLSEHIWVPVTDSTGQSTLHRTAPQRTSTGFNEDEWATITFAYGEDEASIRIDGRA